MVIFDLGMTHYAVGVQKSKLLKKHDIMCEQVLSRIALRTFKHVHELTWLQGAKVVFIQLTNHELKMVEHHR